MGIKAKRKAVVALRSLLVIKMFSRAATTSCPMVSEQEVKKQLEKPSVPGVLRLPKEKTTYLISVISGIAEGGLQ